jgi:hypothetical protein
MKQILAIFTKDARRFWPEILATLAVLVALVLVYPHSWRGNHEVVSMSLYGFLSHGSLGFLAGCLAVVVPVAWWILIARLVHGERLVGNTQFWLTRPYEWPKFLAAKLLFLAAFLYLPFFLAQCALLVAGGFNPLSYLPGLLYNLVLVTGILVLPLTALSVVTAGFGRMTLVVLGAIVFIAAVALLNSLLPSDAGGGVAGPLGGNLSFAILACGCVAAILVQYAKRKTRVAWLLIAMVALSLSALGFVDPDQASMDRRYPADNATPAEITYAPSTLHQPITNGTRDKSELEIALPMRISGVANGSAVIPVALKAAISGSDGPRWESPWQPVYNQHYLPGVWDSTMRFRIRNSVYERFKMNPVNLQLTFAIDQARAFGVSRTALSSSEFDVPGVGICAPQSTWLAFPPEINGINCRSALRRPRLNYITVQWSEAECSTVPHESENVLGTSWIGSFESDPAEFGITSVWETPLIFSNAMASYRQGQPVRPRQLCPGSPVVFTEYRLAGHTQLTVSIPNFRLPDLALGDVYELRSR